MYIHIIEQGIDPWILEFDRKVVNVNDILDRVKCIYDKKAVTYIYQLNMVFS